MRYSNYHDEVVGSVALFQEYLGMASCEKANGSNQQVRKSLHQLLKMDVLEKASFKKAEEPRIHDVFVCRFSKGYGVHASRLWNYAVIHEAEIEKIRAALKRRKERPRFLFLPVLIHLILYVRLVMERPGGVTSPVQIHDESVATVMEEEIRQRIGISPKGLDIAMRFLKKIGLLNFRRRIVREKPHTRQIRIYVVTNASKISNDVLGGALETLRRMFFECSFVRNEDTWADALDIDAADDEGSADNQQEVVV